MLNTAQNTYFNASVNTASPEELTLLLYNGCSRFLKQAIRCIENNDINGKHHNLMKAQDIIIELQATLDMQYEISNQLFALYDYLLRQISNANVTKDIRIIKECIGFVEDLRDTWVEALKSLKQTQRENA